MTTKSRQHLPLFNKNERTWTLVSFPFSLPYTHPSVNSSSIRSGVWRDWKGSATKLWQHSFSSRQIKWIARRSLALTNIPSSDLWRLIHTRQIAICIWSSCGEENTKAGWERMGWFKGRNRESGREREREVSCYTTPSITACMHGGSSLEYCLCHTLWGGWGSPCLPALALKVPSSPVSERERALEIEIQSQRVDSWRI